MYESELVVATKALRKKKYQEPTPAARPPRPKAAGAAPAPKARARRSPPHGAPEPRRCCASAV